MSIVTFNFFWMSLNISLAIIAVASGWLAYKLSKTSLKIFFAIIWLLFVPNTIYMLTDVLHFQEQFSAVYGIDKTIIVLEYSVLLITAIFTFIMAVYPFEQTLKSVLKQKRIRNIKMDAVIVFINFVIAFGVVIGRVQRTNSWEVVTNIPKVTFDIMNTLFSSELLFLVVVFGIINNVIYFSFRKLFK